MYEQVFKNIDNVLWKDSGVATEIDYIEQTSWVLFLKYLTDLENERENTAKLLHKDYKPILEKEFRWDTWACPKDESGKIDYKKALIGDDLKDFVDLKLFPYLKKFKSPNNDTKTIEYKIGEIFGELKNKINSGYTLREVLNLVDTLKFNTKQERYELSHLYESKIKNMGNAGRNGGEYYTPRPLIKAIVKVVNLRIGQTIYDGAVGSAGFLIEAFEYLKNSKDLSAKELLILQNKTFFGKEKKSLAFAIGLMNMILHGIEAPNLIHTNTLSENIMDIQEKDKFDVILANPPFGGKERSEVQQNFPIKTSETAFLFLQHFIKSLKAGGSAGIVIKNTFLSNTDKASVSLRKLLLESCNLHTILDLPGGVFTGAGVKTVVLFFKKGEPTNNIWYYQLNLNRNLGKTNPLNEEDLTEFVELSVTKENSQNSWIQSLDKLDKNTYDLSVKNTNKSDEVILREPAAILGEMRKLDEESRQIFDNLIKFF